MRVRKTSRDASVDDQVDIPLAIARLGVREAVPLVRQRPQRLHQQPHGLSARTDSSPARVRISTPCGRHDVADVPALELLVGAAQRLRLQVDLDLAARVLELRERGLAHDALEHHAARRRARAPGSRPATRRSVRPRSHAGRPRARRGGSRSGKATPASRRRASFARRSAISAFSSRQAGVLALRHDRAAYSPCFRLASMNGIERAVEHGRRIAGLVAGPEVLDARLVEHVRADLVAPADVGLLVLEHARGGVALVDLELVELRLQHLHRGRAVLVLAALALAGDDDARRQVPQAHRGIGLVDVLAARPARAVGVHLDVGRVDLDVDLVVDRPARRTPMRTRYAGGCRNRTATCAPAGARRSRCAATRTRSRRRPRSRRS